MNAALCLTLLWTTLAQEPAMTHVPENTYVGELLRYPGPYQFQVGRQGIILVTDAELETIARDPEAVIDTSVTFEKHQASLRQICERGQAAGQRTLLLAFDHFFKQYRPGTDQPRKLLPDGDDYIALLAQVGKFAQQYGLALELSLLSPLEVGPGFQRATGESGRWMHYRKGLRDPVSGAYSVDLWRQQQWCNNKGVIRIEDAGVRVFAFKEAQAGTNLVVNPADIVEISDTAQVEVYEGLTQRTGDYRAQRVRIHGRGRAELAGLNKVLVVQVYRTPELDYFSPRALPFLTGLVDRYADAGIHLNALYSDEMHIQQDWGYHSHHDNGEFAVRYVSDGFQRAFAERYGAEYADFAKYLVYFCRGQEDARNDVLAKVGLQHLLGATPEAVRQTSLLRSRYYQMLQDGVVDLFVTARRHAERRMGHLLDTRAHATWAESPTCDYWQASGVNGNSVKYEYTSNFLWSETVHQSAAACSDYFKWGEFLTGTGNDHSEGGWLDRNYYGLALGCSTGIINEVPFSYAAHWGSPREVSQRHGWLQAAYGTAAGPQQNMVAECQHRDVEVLMLYPLDLVSVDERFGSWMTQYGYANYLTTAKVLELGQVVDGALVIAGRRFTTVVALFEPHPPAALLELLRQLLAAGGQVVWSGPPPLLSAEGQPLPQWGELFGVDCPTPLGLAVPGRVIGFEGALAAVQPQTVLTDLLVDRIYPLTPREGTQPAARTGPHLVGTTRTVGTGTACVLGFRPRDDQAQSLGYDARTWIDTLTALGAYPPSGRFAGYNDNPQVLSRGPGDVLYCRFPNGTVAAAPHLRQYVENWPGGFGRKAEDDAKIMAAYPPPSADLVLDNVRVAGHAVNYRGLAVVLFRLDAAGRLIAFCGHHSNQISIDGRTHRWAAGGLGTTFWCPVPPERRVPGGALMILQLHGRGDIRIPAVDLPDAVEVVTEGPRPGSRGKVIASRLEGDTLVVQLGDETPLGLLYVVPK
ncbi:MAG: hypothetical protein IT204_00260 [Fimbriimonadaceae bacterium]|nr:hypothetical protein [Fimbriimonadaceae bacterium]